MATYKPGDHFSMSPPTEGPEMLEAVKAALEFYADPKRYEGANCRVKGEPDKHQPADLGYLLDVTRDRGAIARRALAILAIEGK